MKKKLIVIAIALAVVALPVVAAVTKATLINSNGDKVVVTSGSSEAQAYFNGGYVLMGAPYTTKVEKVCDCESLGGFYSPDITGIQERTKSIAKTSIYASTTLQLKDSGTTYLLSASGTSITLPAVSRAGTWFRFVVAGAMDTASTTINSAAGDDVEGSIIVAGAIVDCNAADKITIDAGNENIGDFIELVSTGTYWVPLSSGFTTAAVNTCSG